MRGDASEFYTGGPPRAVLKFAIYPTIPVAISGIHLPASLSAVLRHAFLIDTSTR